MKKLDLTTLIDVVKVERNPQTGEQIQKDIKESVAESIIRGLNRSRTLQESVRKSALIAKIKANPASVQVEDSEYADIKETIQNATTIQKAAFANMVLAKNPDLKLEEL